jgi:predicted phage gp36 major capsid-like protein
MFVRKSLCEADLTCAACIADMPDVAAGSMSIAFGDFKRDYLIVDR